MYEAGQAKHTTDMNAVTGSEGNATRFRWADIYDDEFPELHAQVNASQVDNVMAITGEDALPGPPAAS